MKVEDVLNKFGSCKRSGKWFLVKCPCHKDDVASLALCDNVYQDKHGNLKTGISVKCFAGCNSSEIKKYLRTGYTNYYNANTQSSDKQKEHVKGRIVETYPYTRDGEYIYEVVRWEPKQFSQRRKDKKGKYIWGITEGFYYESKYGWHAIKEDVSKYKTVKFFPKIEPMLYNLDYIKLQLQKNPEAKVFIVGGEKDVNNLKNINFLATTNSGGEGQDWQPSFNEDLKGLNIAFIPDNDLTGYAHLYKVAESLIPHVKSFKVIELPSLTKEHEDVSDFLEKYDGDADYLKELYIHADDYKNKPERIKTDFKYVPVTNTKTDDLTEFLDRLTSEMEEMAKIKDISLLGLCPDCRGSGYASTKNGYQVRQNGEHLSPIPCSCTIKIEGGLDFNDSFDSDEPWHN